MSRKLTHEEYLQTLKNKNIKVLPIENYNGMDTKIKHRCECNNEWLVTPSKVKAGRKCGCSKQAHNKVSNEKYLEELKIKNPHVKPLEKYLGRDTKILHKCKCSKEWTVSPRVVLRGGKCGCGRGSLTTIETYRDRRTILYYIKVNNLYKIGLSIWEVYDTPEDNILKRRYAGEKYSEYKIEIINYKVYDNGAEAFLTEKVILDMYDEKRYIHISDDMNNFGGYTELFTENILDK